MHILDCIHDRRTDRAIKFLDRFPMKGVGGEGIGPLKVYLQHLIGDYSGANSTIDHITGMDFSGKLTIKNCPSEAEIISKWDDRLGDGVSVLCGTFNHARFIGMALAGIFSQITARPFEVIVRDDASTDCTSEILADWEKKYPNILRVIRLPENTYSQGVPPLHDLLMEARYPLIAMCEGDDFWCDQMKLEKQSHLLSLNPTWSAVVHNHLELDEARGLLRQGRVLSGQGYLPRQDLLRVKTVLWVHTIMFRREHLCLPYYSHKDGVLGDQVVTAMLAKGGPIFYLGNMNASVARRNLFSTYTPLSELERVRMRLKTREFLARTLSEQGEVEAATYLVKWCEETRSQHPELQTKT